MLLTPAIKSVYLQRMVFCAFGDNDKRIVYYELLLEKQAIWINTVYK